MKKTNFSWKRLLRVTMAMILVLSMLLMCGCGKKDDEKEQNKNNGIQLGDGDGKLEAQDVVDGISKIYGNLLGASGGNNGTGAGGVDMDMTVTLGEDLMDMLETMLKQSGEDIDISWFRELGISMNVNYGENMDTMQMLLYANLNGKPVISADMIMDIANNMMYIGVPELNDKYLGQEVDMSQATGAVNALTQQLGQYADYLSGLPTEQELNTLLTRYLNIALEAKTAPTTSSETLSLGGISQNVTATKHTLSRMDVLNILEAILVSAQTDKELEKALDSLSKVVNDISSEQIAQQGGTWTDIDLHQQMQEAIPEALEDLRESKADLEDQQLLSLTVYTDGEKQVGFDLQIEHVVTGYEEEYVYDESWGDYYIERVPVYGSVGGYLYNLSSGDQTAFCLSIQNAFRLEGTGTQKSGKANGTYALIVHDQEMAQIQVKDFDTVALAQGNLVGTLRLSLADELADELLGGVGFLNDPVLELGLNINGNGGSISYSLYNGNSMLIGMSVSLKTTDGGKIELPKKYADMSDPDAITDWAMGMDFDEVLDNLKRAGVSKDLLEMLEDALDNAMGGF